LTTTSPLRISTAAFVAGLLLAAACLFFTFFLTILMSHPGGGDPAGDAIGREFTSIALLLFCHLLGALVLTAVLGGAMPRSGRTAILLLAPAAFVAMFRASDLLTKPSVSPGQWALIIPAAAPTLIVAYCLWALIAPLRARVPERVAGFGLLGALGLVCAAIFPLEAMRTHGDAVVAADQAALEAKVASMPDDAGLAQWIPLLNSGVYSVEETARAKILALPSRQRDAEAMLARDEFPLGELNQFDLDATPALCQNAQASLSRRAAALALKPGEKPDFDKIAAEFYRATVAIPWLVSLGCASDAQALQWEALGRSYGKSDTDVLDLVEARDPKNLGWKLIYYPPRASMLTPKTTLRAWLNFAYGLYKSDPADRPRLLAGARALDHRNADALAWLQEVPAASDSFVLLHFLPQLDLDTTPALCAAALSEIGKELAALYRPTADNPLPFRELGERLGAGEPLVALQWLAGHGCDANAQLSAAEEVIAAYQPSPERETMAAALAKLKRSP
jgi:hypothetical protein